MKRSSGQRDELSALLFGLTDKSVEFRNRWRILAGLAIWLVLSGLTMLLTVFQPEQTTHRLVITGLSFVKYLPLLLVVYSMAKAKAAHYLDDIYELHDETLASNFIEDIAFGEGRESITINEGKISEQDEQSPIILIGGPGEIQVNLGSAALLEKINGEPEVIYPSSEAWKLGRFERIREIGKHDEVGKREYAAINLRDQFVDGISVKARTKDGIPIEALNIKIIFSILRKSSPQDDAFEEDPFSFEPNAIKALVYNQTIITPPPSSPSGVTFPWDTTVIPIVTYELEKIITSHTLSEILSSVSQKEVDDLTKNEQTIAQMRMEMTGEHTLRNHVNNNLPPNFKSRTKITAQFFEPAFKEKAAKLGVSIHWIDIGTWQLPSAAILEKLKEAWNLTRENIKRRNTIEHSAKKHEMNAIIELVNNVIIANYEKSSTRRLTDKEIADLAKLMDSSADIATSPYLLRQLAQQSVNKRDAHTIAIEILRAIRRELIAAMELIKKENRSSIEKQVDLAKIEKALHDIDHNLFHYIQKTQ